ncbi:Outer membrane receptor proteins, mostly Fe transport [Robiginitalea myxolifaciens]|uniref:Outer membrane receptor proteins, mostly Fe transport n=1 Tax=Robiginitalea myxolifaciens TaxID=400055 RepID=A0A1I6G7J9_9FLAO|nr:TonB-dependent receptor [Robiginitalea myxolifaciens]SFR38027.1 Outer membrane receptor proteins, mostly Fe transport [Robiginitalea myxolifaciens]
MRTLLLLSLLFCGLGGYAQTVTTGTVTDENGEPVPGANIVIVGTTEGTTADFDGNFSLTTDRTPPFTLQITSIGFSSSQVEVTANNQQLSIILSEAQTFLDEVVISASRTPERIFESPVSVERFGLQQIASTSAPSFYDGLQNLKGVDIISNSLTFQSVNTRGFASFANTRFMQLVDGMDNTAPGLNFVLGNLVGMSELEVQSVEILPGASSALYGAGAFNGILFMNSKSPFDFQGISAYFKTGFTAQDAAGNNQYYDVGIRAAHAFSDKLAVKANFSFLQGEDWHANNFVDLANPGADRSNPAYDGLNIYGDEVSTLLNFDALAGLPSGTIGSATVSRTGYAESELMNYGAQSVKTDFSVFYRPFADDFEIIYNGRIGRGNTIYQGANRYAIRDFILQQHRLEIRNKNFFIRGYITSENAGNSYDTRFAAINVNRRWKDDTQWFTDYAQTYIGARLGVGTGVQLDDATAHAAARQAADTGRLIPGTREFDNALAAVTSDGDLTTGAKFIDNTKFRHVNANYNLSHVTGEFADIQIGGSFREYELNSSGTIFTDIDGPITYNEYGAYIQLQRKFLDDRLKFTGSVRYDKNEFFDGFLSPRASLLATLGPERNHNLRVSVQQGFRNPTTQDLFIGLNAGRAILVGSAPDNLDRDIRQFDISAQGQALTGTDRATIVGRAAYENAFSAASVQAGNPQAVETDLVQPEEITAYEAGYRAQIGKLAIDISGYYNRYQNFIANTFVLVPLYGNVGDPGASIGDANGPDQLALAALQNQDLETYQTYTNSPADVESWGVVAGVDMKVLGGFDLGVNYSYIEQEFDQAANPDFRTQFNMPNHKVKASFGHRELFKNFGFQVNYRWSDTYLWQNTFADGIIDAYSVLDAQVSYRVPQWRDSVFKLGGSNILGDEYFSAFGTGAVGSIFYISWTVNP